MANGQILREIISGGFEAKFPIATRIVKSLGEATIDAMKSPGEPTGTFLQRLEQRAKENPTITNDTNAEHPMRSGVTVGGGATLSALGSALGLVAYQYLTTGEVSEAAFVAAFGLVFVGAAGAAFTLIRRLVPGWKPLTWFGLLK